MGSRARPLPSDEVAVARAGAAFARRDFVGVHAQAGRTARLAPFEAGVGEDFVEALGFRLTFHQTRTRYHDRPLDVCRLVPPAQHVGGGAQVFDAAVGAAADKHVLDFDFGQLLPRGQPHVFQAFAYRFLLGGVGEAFRRWDRAADRGGVFGAGAPGDGGADVRCVDPHRFVERGARIGGEAAPPCDCGVPFNTVGRIRAALQIRERSVVGSDQPGARACLDAHVAHGQAALDAHALEHRATVFDHVAVAARGADHADDVEDQVFGRDSGAELAIDAHFHRPRFAQQQRLRRQHVLDLAGADPECQRADPAVRGGVAVAADDGGTGQRKALFWPDDMDDPLLAGGSVDIADAERGGVALQRGELLGAFGVGNRDAIARRVEPGGGRQVVIGDRQREVGAANAAPAGAQRFERLRAGHLVDEVAVDEQQRGTILARLDDMRVPDLFIKCTGSFGHASAARNRDPAWQAGRRPALLRDASFVTSAAA